MRYFEDATGLLGVSPGEFWKMTMREFVMMWNGKFKDRSQPNLLGLESSIEELERLDGDRSRKASG